MTSTLLDLLKFVLRALLYLFFTRVLWAVWVNVRNLTRTATAHPDTTPTRLVDIVTGADWPLAPNNTITIGRDPVNTIHLDDPSVSTHHCRKTMRNNEPHIDDLGSTNGTTINGARITTTHPIAAGDLITLGTISVEAR